MYKRQEWLYHLGVPVEDIAELAEHSANTVPVMMPYIDAFFMPRAKGDRVSLGVEAENASSDITATDDTDVNAEVDLTVVALTLDADGRVTSAIGDMVEPALTIAADGGVTAPDTLSLIHI